MFAHIVYVKWRNEEIQCNREILAAAQLASAYEPIKDDIISLLT